MSDYYNIPRGKDWNYGGNRFRLSRSKIDLSRECSRCFYLDNKLGIKRPPGYPFNLNTAVDALLKKEFDIHRVGKTTHPLMQEYGIDAVPFQHEKMDEWRENFKGIETQHLPTGFTVSGAIDDVWVTPEEELIIVDYKSTSKDDEITLDAPWQDGYKRQMEVYQWLFRQNGFTVSDTGYFVYANGQKDREAFDGKLEFEVTIIPYTGSDGWVEDALKDAKRVLESEEIPKADPDCDYCLYREVAGKTLLKRHADNKVTPTSSRSSKEKDDKDTGETKKLF